MIKLSPLSEFIYPCCEFLANVLETKREFVWDVDAILLKTLEFKDIVAGPEIGEAVLAILVELFSALKEFVAILAIDAID